MKNLIITLTAISSLMISCASIPQQRETIYSITYKEGYLHDNVYVIVASSSVKTYKELRPYAHRRAAELTIQNGFDFFESYKPVKPEVTTTSVTTKKNESNTVLGIARIAPDKPGTPMEHHYLYVVYKRGSQPESAIDAREFLKK